MKHRICLFVALSLSINAYAKEIQLDDGARIVIEDENPYSQLCLAALESREAIKAKVEELGIGRRAQKQVVCNDLSLYEFAEKSRVDMREWSVANVQ